MTTTEATAAAAGLAMGVGWLAKTWKPFPNWAIPTLVAGVGAVTVPFLLGWTAENVVSGIQAGLSATGLNQLYRQSAGARSGNTETFKKDPQ